jgi:hypothetical protein
VRRRYSRSWRNAPSWRLGWLGRQPRYAAFFTPSPSFLHSSKVEIEIFYLPAYAPEHNPDEYLNNDLKQTIKNKPRAKSRDDLVAATSSILKSIQRRPDRVKSYFHAKHVRYAA